MHINDQNSPLTETEAQQLTEIIAKLTPEQRAWVGQYLVENSNNTTIPSSNEATESSHITNSPDEADKPRSITILYGTETGNAQTVAETLNERLVENGFTVTISEMDDYKFDTLAQSEDLFLISSTHGEGEPPISAISFYEFLYSEQAPNLADVRYSVLALGDESFEFFCQAGKDFDERVAELGATRLVERVDCDFDYEESAESWMQQVLSAVGDQDDNRVAATDSTESVLSMKERKYSKSNPYYAEVLENINLNGEGSNKEVRHIELLLDNYGEGFEPGDSLDIFPANDDQLVMQLIAMLGWDPYEDIILDNGDAVSVVDALTHHFEITKLTPTLLKNMAVLINDDELNNLVLNDTWVKDYIYGRDLIDLFSVYYPPAVSPDIVIENLRKLPPRTYSIASSYKANPNEVHITVKAVRYESYGRARNGVCSTQLADRVKPGESVRMCLKKNPSFKFPFDEDTKVIMIGPGTGVAPFRSFLEEREDLNLKGNTWLFFGDQKRATDFLYEADWQAWLANGTLAKLDLAFSRDTASKLYVQDKIKENSELFYQWLESGAAIYICGDETYMAKAVHEAIREVIATESKCNEEEAEAYLTQLKVDRRYQRDVY